MKRLFVIAMLVVLCSLAGIVAAAPGVPWNYNLWEDVTISATPEAQSVTLENTTTGHMFYHFAEGVTTTVGIIVNEGFDGETEYTQYAEGSTDATTDVSGVITLTMVYPEVTVLISTTSGAGEATVGLWQR